MSLHGFKHVIVLSSLLYFISFSFELSRIRINSMIRHKMVVMWQTSLLKIKKFKKFLINCQLELTLLDL